MDTIEKALQKKAEKNRADKTNTLDQLADQQVKFDALAVKQAQQHQSYEQSPPVREQIEPEPLITTNQTVQNNTELPSKTKQGHLKNNQSKSVTINIKNLENMGFLSPNGSNSVLNEEYRQIKRPLLNNVRGKSAHPIENANIIQVTSSLQGEGKTFTSINLAIALAMELDFNVLLVDADVIKSSVTRTLINRTEKGLTDFLSGYVTNLSDVLLSTNIEKLKILPAGTRNQLSSELLNSQQMEDLISEFSNRYENRIVIIDSPPILQTNESRILAQKVGQIVFVVEQNKTEKSTVKNALNLLSGDMVIGMVMNKSRTSKSGDYYGYYGYGR